MFDPREAFSPEGTPLTDWYFVNWHWFLATVDDELTSVAQFAGAFFLFPARYAPSYFLGIPIGFHSGTIIWYCFCTSPKEVNTNPPFVYALMGIALTLAMISSYEYLVHRYYHMFLRSVAAIKSLLFHLPDLDRTTKERCLDVEFNNLKNFQSRF